jgi:hypothetical protein
MARVVNLPFHHLSVLLIACAKLERGYAYAAVVKVSEATGTGAVSLARAENIINCIAARCASYARCTAAIRERG